MPIYSYKCENCDYHCNTVALRKVYQPVGIVFKGKGFYATDNRSPSGQKYSHKTEGDGGNGSKSPSESKTESSSKEPAKANATPTAE